MESFYLALSVVFLPILLDHSTEKPGKRNEIIVYTIETLLFLCYH